MVWSEVAGEVSVLARPNHSISDTREDISDSYLMEPLENLNEKALQMVSTEEVGASVSYVACEILDVDPQKTDPALAKLE
jgi:hypothetical protein